MPLGFAVPALPATTTELPPATADAVRVAYRALATQAGEARPKVAVRSSALDEDGAAASFTGQHATFLNVTGEDGVLEAITKCCASAASEVARATERCGTSMQATFAWLCWCRNWCRLTSRRWRSARTR